MSYKYIFHNFTDKPFTGHWNGKPYTFKPGVKKYYPHLIARHFAKHLTNQILIESDKEVFTSPKKPDEVPVFMEVFHKAFIVEQVADEDNLDIDGDGSSDEPSMNIQTKPREIKDPYDASAVPQTGPAGPSKVIPVEPDNEEEEGYEDNKKDDTPSED